MAIKDYNPTAANILSSLGVKGATEEGGTGKSGYVPVLNSEGKLNESVLDLDSIKSSVTVDPLPGAVFVDASATGEEDGSVVHPYRSLANAAASGATSFIVVAGSYGTENVIINDSTVTVVKVFCMGAVSFDKLTLSGYANGTTFIFNDLTVSTLYFSTYSASAVITGRSVITTFMGGISDPDDELSTQYVNKVYIGPKVEVGEWKNVDTEKIGFLASSDRIANDSGKIDGKSVSDALDNIGTELNTIENRKIRIPTFKSTKNTGIEVDSHEDVPVSGDENIYDIENIGESLATAANGIFHKDNDSPVYDAVTATEITTETLNLGSNYIISFDPDGFLVISG